MPAARRCARSSRRRIRRSTGSASPTISPRVAVMSSVAAGASAIARRFQERSAEGRAVLVPYLTAGFPEPTTTVPMLEAAADAGADVIELGIPFSDPLADGPTIQRASFVALERGATVDRALE